MVTLTIKCLLARSVYVDGEHQTQYLIADLQPYRAKKWWQVYVHDCWWEVRAVDIDKPRNFKCPI
jgi:hypothetical protein